jgi:hypothetical protein
MCTQKISHSRIKVEENKVKAVFRNDERSNFEVTQIDDFVVKDGVRCDKLVSRCDDISILVELKGSDVSHAKDQLFSSATNNDVQLLLKGTVGFLVVCTKYPKFDTFVKKAKDRAAKEFGTGFHVVKNMGEFNIERVAAIDGPY